MWLRRAFFHWMLPSALVLPIWLLIGWIAFSASGWALIWVLLIAMPSVLVGQLVLTMLVRARGTVRHSRAVSWMDVAGFGLWHVLTIAVGFYPQAAFWPLLGTVIAVFLALFWSTLWQLFQEARPSMLLRTSNGVGYIPPQAETPRTRQEPEVFIVTEERRES